MEAGLPPIRLHDLRHGAATFLLAAGYDMKVVQETLRLSSIAIASDIYTSVLPQLGRQAAEDAAALIHNADHHPASHPPEPSSATITPLPPHAQPNGDANPHPDAGQSQTHNADGPDSDTNAQAS